jgi:hypothetical protein
MSEQLTLPSPKGIPKRTVAIIATLLIVALTVSLLFNIQYYTSDRNHCEFNSLQVHLADYQWKETQVDTEKNLYFVYVNITLANPDTKRDAIVTIAYGMYDSSGNMCFASTPNGSYGTGGNRPSGFLSTFDYPLARYMTPCGIIANSTVFASFHFYYQKPQDSGTHLMAEIIGVIPL